MVYVGVTSHIITDTAKFKTSDNSFKAEKRCMDLAEGTRCYEDAKPG